MTRPAPLCCLERHGISRLMTKRSNLDRAKLERSPIGYFHVDQPSFAMRRTNSISSQRSNVYRSSLLLSGSNSRVCWGGRTLECAGCDPSLLHSRMTTPFPSRTRLRFFATSRWPVKGGLILAPASQLEGLSLMCCVVTKHCWPISSLTVLLVAHLEIHFERHLNETCGVKTNRKACR